MKNNMTAESICNAFPINNEEYFKLEKEFGQLTKYASWQLLKKNAKNNHTDDFDDINQELVVSVLIAGSYYKRQTYIENCLEAAKKYVKDKFIGFIVGELDELWANRTRHGANRQKFGQHQEKVLDEIIISAVPIAERPNRTANLKIDTKFSTYCKAVAWNKQKSLGRKITKEKDVRASMASLSEFDYLASQT